MAGSNHHEQVIEDGGNLFNIDNEASYVNRNKKNVNDLMHMVVSSEEEAYKLYNEYATRIGFSIRRGNTRYHSGTKDFSQKEYYCSCQGFNQELDPYTTRFRNRFETRCGCEAMIRFSVKDGVWRVMKFSESHNHELASPNEVHLLRSNRALSVPKANVIDTMVNAGVSTKNVFSYLSREVGGREHIGFTERDCYNYVTKEKMILIEAGDSQSVINHFKLRQNEDAMFFYTVQVDQENRMTNFFWRDGRSRIDYDFFGDVVVFDTTFRTNKYDLICAPFVGVNHHWQNIMFGCAFLLDETTSSFVWLFQSFLELMGGKAPKTIITDQDQAMSNAISQVFPTSRHRLCQWHIAKNAPSHLGKFNSDAKFRGLFYKCLHGCDNEEEFQHTWDKMMNEFSDLRNHKWLNNLYKIRKKWCSALNKDVFSGDIRSSQRSESTNHVLNGIASKTTSLTKFVLSFEDLVAGWRYDEGVEDFNCKKGLPPRSIPGSGILNHAAKVYTTKLFLLFQREFLDGIATNWSELSSSSDICSFKITREEDSRVRIIHFDEGNMDISCTCKKFESMGLLCSHTLKILVIKNVNRIPNKYILSRWTKNAKKRILESEKEVLHPDNCGETETIFRNNAMRCAYDLIMRSQKNESTREICRNALRKLEGDLSKELARLNSDQNDGMGENDELQEKQADAAPILNPPTVKPKGVSNGRLKGHFEKRGKRKAKTSSDSGKKMCTNIEETHHIGEKSQQYFSSNQAVDHQLVPSNSMLMPSVMSGFPSEITMSTPSQFGMNSQMHSYTPYQGYGYNLDVNNNFSYSYLLQAVEPENLLNQVSTFDVNNTGENK